MRGLPTSLSLSSNEFDKVIDTGARMLILYPMTLKLFCNRVVYLKTSRFLPPLLWESFHNVTKICKSLKKKTSCLSILKHGVITLPDATSCDKLHLVFNAPLQRNAWKIKDRSHFPMPLVTRRNDSHH